MHLCYSNFTILLLLFTVSLVRFIGEEILFTYVQVNREAESD